MTSEQRSAWIMLVLAITVYAVYLGLVLPQLRHVPVEDVDYVAPMLLTIGGSIVASIIVTIVVQILAGMRSPKDAGRTDQRDRQIGRFGEYVGHWVLVAGALGALLLAITEQSTFWIANVIYLAFVLSQVVASVARLTAYRRGLQSW